MADLMHTDIACSFRKVKFDIDEVTPDNCALPTIEQLLESAGQAYRGLERISFVLRVLPRGRWAPRPIGAHGRFAAASRLLTTSAASRD
jgi:hypothetical protein